jgi:hypothetical protein
MTSIGDALQPFQYTMHLAPRSASRKVRTFGVMITSATKITVSCQTCETLTTHPTRDMQLPPITPTRAFTPRPKRKRVYAVSANRTSGATTPQQRPALTQSRPFDTTKTQCLHLISLHEASRLLHDPIGYYVVRVSLMSRWIKSSCRTSGYSAGRSAVGC